MDKESLTYKKFPSLIIQLQQKKEDALVQYATTFDTQLTTFLQHWYDYQGYKKVAKDVEAFKSLYYPQQQFNCVQLMLSRDLDTSLQKIRTDTSKVLLNVEKRLGSGKFSSDTTFMQKFQQEINSLYLS